MENKEYASFFVKDKNGEPLSIGALKMPVFDHMMQGSDIDYFKGAIKEMVEYAGHDIIIAPEYCFLSKGMPMAEKQKNEILDDIREASKGRDVLVLPGTVVWKNVSKEMRNTSYAIYDGEIIFEYDKRVDGGEKEHAFVNGLKPKFGKKNGCF